MRWCLSCVVGETNRKVVTVSPRAKHSAILNSLKMVGLTRFELVTPRLSSVCSNQLSYRPDFAKASSGKPPQAPYISKSPVFIRQAASRGLSAEARDASEGGFSQN